MKNPVERDKYYRNVLLLIPLVAVFIAVIFKFEDVPSDMSVYLKMVHSVFFTAIIWLGCMAIVEFLWKKYPWVHNPFKHLIYEVLLILIFTNTFSYFIFHLEVKLGMVDLDEDIYLNIVITNIITLFITTIHEAVFFYKQWKINFSKSVRLEKDNIEAKYETLKTQINPHFLFNSLNSLITLVDDNEEAVEYIQNLSEFLRYMLKSRDRELVLVREEVEIAKKYLDIQKSRFKENLKIEMDIPESAYHYSLPPLVLQMLIENSLKHNVISKDKPLDIKIRYEHETIYIENNLQKRANGQSTGHGLNNIVERYKFFTSRAVKITETHRIFKVEIPLLKAEL